MWPDARAHLESRILQAARNTCSLEATYPPPLPISQVIFVFYGIDGKGVYTRVDVERTFRKFIEAIHFSLLRPQSFGVTVVYI